MRITNLFSGFALAVSVLLSSLAMAAESHAQHEKQKAKSTSQVQSKDMAHEHTQMLKQKNAVGLPSSEKQAQTQPSKQSKAQKGDHHVHH